MVTIVPGSAHGPASAAFFLASPSPSTERGPLNAMSQQVQEGSSAPSPAALPPAPPQTLCPSRRGWSLPSRNRRSHDGSVPGVPRVRSQEREGEQSDSCWAPSLLRVRTWASPPCYPSSCHGEVEMLLSYAWRQAELGGVWTCDEPFRWELNFTARQFGLNRRLILEQLHHVMPRALGDLRSGSLNLEGDAMRWKLSSPQNHLLEVPAQVTTKFRETRVLTHMGLAYLPRKTKPTWNRTHVANITGHDRTQIALIQRTQIFVCCLYSKNLPNYSLFSLDFVWAAQINITPDDFLLKLPK